MSEYLPIELDAESVRIEEQGSGWGIIIETPEYGELYVWIKQSDALYDHLLDLGAIGIENGEVVSYD